MSFSGEAESSSAASSLSAVIPRLRSCTHTSSCPPRAAQCSAVLPSPLPRAGHALPASTPHSLSRYLCVRQATRIGRPRVRRVGGTHERQDGTRIFVGPRLVVSERGRGAKLRTYVCTRKFRSSTFSRLTDFLFCYTTRISWGGARACQSPPPHWSPPPLPRNGSKFRIPAVRGNVPPALVKPPSPSIETQPPKHRTLPILFETHGTA